MLKLNNCCHTESLTKVKEVYRSNSDEFTLYQCNTCKKFWLYRKLEANKLEFDTILMTHGYLYLSTMNAVETSYWKQIRE